MGYYISRNTQVEESHLSLSFHHSYTKAKLIGALLKFDDRFNVFSDLNLRIEDRNYKPDICLYPKQEVNLSSPDIKSVSEKPILAIEILSQDHKVEDILDKFFSYFTSVVKSCWLVIPVAGAVIVYSAPENAERFTTGNIVDKQLNIQVSLQEIFE